MIQSAEALEIIAYLKTAPNKFVSILEISRRAAGRRRFEEAPNWAKNLISPLVEAGILEVNSRGHYRLPLKERAESKPQAAPAPSFLYPEPRARVVGDNYFSESDAPRIVGGDYFPVGG